MEKQIRIFGIAEPTGENTNAIVRRLCRDKLGVELREEALCKPIESADSPSLDLRRAKASSDYCALRLLPGTAASVRGKEEVERVWHHDLQGPDFAEPEVLRKAAEIRQTWSLDGRIFWLDKEWQERSYYDPGGS